MNSESKVTAFPESNYYSLCLKSVLGDCQSFFHCSPLNCDKNPSENNRSVLYLLIINNNGSEESTLDRTTMTVTYRRASH